VPERLRVVAPYVIVLALAGVLFWVAAHFEYEAHPGRLGPDVWPRAVLVLMAAVCVVRIVTGLRQPRDAGPGGGVLQDVLAQAESSADGAGPPIEHHPGLLLLGIALTVGYVLALHWLGFALSTALYIGAMIRTGRYRNWLVIVPTALLGSLLFMFVFMKVVYLSLPIGTAPFDEVSLTLMRLMAIR
jgi:putative tricarboxylic transport membrane protein